MSLSQGSRNQFLTVEMDDNGVVDSQAGFPPPPPPAPAPAAGAAGAGDDGGGG